MATMFEYAILILSLCFLSTGYLVRNRHSRIGEPVAKPSVGMISIPHVPISYEHISALGWFLLGVYWLTQIPDYLDISDYINAMICTAAFPFFTFIAYKEISMHSNGNGTGSEGSEGLRFLSRITIITLTGYTIISAVPIVEGSLEYFNAYIVAAFLTATGFPSKAGAMDLSGNSPWIRSNDLIISAPILHDGHNEILITLSCTAFFSILLFSAAIFSAREPRRIKMKAFMLTIPVMFILNIIRMAMISYLTYTETTSPEFAHHILGKIGSLLALLFLAWVLLTFLPSLQTSTQDAYATIFGNGKEDKGKSGTRSITLQEKIR